MDTRARAAGATQPPPKPTSVTGAERRKRCADEADKQVPAAKRTALEPEPIGRGGLRSSTGKTVDGSVSQPAPGFYTDKLLPSTLLSPPGSARTLGALRPPSAAAAVAAKQSGSRFLYLKSPMREKTKAWREFEDKLVTWQCMHSGVSFGDGFIKMDFISNKVAEEVRVYLQKQGIDVYISLDPPPPTSVPASPLPLPGPDLAQAGKTKPVGLLASVPQTPNPKAQTSNPKPQTPRSTVSRPLSPTPTKTPRPLRDCIATLTALATARSNSPIVVGKGPPRPASGGKGNVVQSTGYRCNHGRRKGLCVECGGGSICDHGRQKHWCKQCGGSARCSHGRQKSRCKDCGGSGICSHGRHKYRCTKCNPKHK